MASEFITLRATLKETLTEFLEKEKMDCLVTLNGLVDVINALSLYREEGRSLFPKIFIFDDLDTILKILIRHEHLRIGAGSKEKSTFLKALRKCAPLAQGGWDIYILRKSNSLEFGLIKSIGNVLTLSTEDALIKTSDEHIPVIMAHQISEKNVMIVGVLGNSILVNFGATKDESEPSLEDLYKFIRLLTSEIPAKIKERSELFYGRLFEDVLREGHGMLAAIISNKKKKIPSQFKDSTVLSSPIIITDKILSLLNNSDIDSNSRLEASTSIIKGMLCSDGVTIFNTHGDVLAYSAFVKHKSSIGNNEVSGGARSRTFEVLSSMVGKQIICAFMQSQDGAISCRGVTKNER